MKRHTLILVVACVLAACLGWAQEKKMSAGGDMPGGVRGAYLKQAMHSEEEMVSLCNAIPQEKFNWRPMEGVRSIAEAFLHVARGNYGIAKMVGAKLPEGIDPEKVETSSTDKKEIVAALKKSYAFINETIKNTPESNYDKHVDFFGMDMTILDMIFLTAGHQHELLGQQIAYARMNGVVPPWTAERQAKMKKEGSK